MFDQFTSVQKVLKQQETLFTVFKPVTKQESLLTLFFHSLMQALNSYIEIFIFL